MEINALITELRLRRPTELAARAYYASMGKLLLPGRARRSGNSTVEEYQHLLEPASSTETKTERRFFAVGAQALWLDSSLGNSDYVVSAANQILKLEFSALGSKTVSFPHGVDWRHSLHRNGSWPEGRREVNYKNLSEIGDIKCCWEWNRHQIFVTLGRAYRLTGDESYTRCFSALLTSWCEQNPPETGIHYLSNLELGLRCVSWLWSHHLFVPSSQYSAETRGLLRLHSHLMARHISANLNFSRLTARNNHLIGDTACLAIYAITNPGAPDSPAWEKRSLHLLWRSVRRQIRPDGMHFEGSFGYHRFVLELLTQVIVLCDQAGIDVPYDVLDLVELMFEVLGGAILPDGSLPNLNDDDDGRALPFDAPRSDWARNLLTVGASIFGRDDWRSKASPFAEEEHWMLGDRSATALFEHAAVAQPAKTTALPESGIFIFRSKFEASEDITLFDNHPDAFPDSGHGHASLLQLLVWVSGRPFLIDGGTYRYSSDEGFRNVLRSTRAHNTVEVDLVGQAQPARNFGWTSKLKTGPTEWREGPNWVLVDGNHDSYQRLREPIRHRRVVLWIKSQRLWLVCDEFVGQGRHRFDQHWHFAHQGILSIDTHGTFKARAGADQVTVDLFTCSDDQIETYSGDPNVPSSWHSSSYGVIEPRTTVTRTWKAEAPSTRWTAFFVGDEQDLRSLNIDVHGQKAEIKSLGFELHLDSDVARLVHK